MPIKSTETSFLATTSLVAWTEFVELTGIGEDLIRELMVLGWLQPARQTDQAPLFRQIDVYKTRKVDRLCEDFELPSLARSHYRGPAGTHRGTGNPSERAGQVEKCTALKPARAD